MDSVIIISEMAKKIKDDSNLQGNDTQQTCEEKVEVQDTEEKRVTVKALTEIPWKTK